MKNAIAYERVSTAGQGRSGLGLEAQRATIARFAAQEGFRIVESFAEAVARSEHAATAQQSRASGAGGTRRAASRRGGEISRHSGAGPRGPQCWSRAPGRAARTLHHPL